MIERLKEIIKYYELTASALADKIDVPRSSISHLLSGRNKASLDFVMKVVDNFEEVELDWLIYGKGVFPKANKIDKVQRTLFESDIREKKIKPKLSENEPEVNKVIETKKSTQSKKLTKVILIYEDGSFEDFRNN